MSSTQTIIEQTEKQLADLKERDLKELAGIKKLKLGQIVYLSGTNHFDIDYYPCIVKKIDVKRRELKLYEKSIRRYHNVDYSQVSLKPEL